MRKLLTVIFIVIALSSSPVIAAGDVKAPPPGSPTTGTAVWRSGSSTIPLYSDWNGTSFDPSDNTAAAGDWRIIAGAKAPTRDEIILVGIDEGNTITGLMWNGSSWSALPFNNLASVSESFWWSFAVGYEQVSGDALLVWRDGGGLSYRTWNGTSWSSPFIKGSPFGEPKQMKIASSPDSDEMLLVVSDADSKDFVLNWNGSVFSDGDTLDASGSGDNRSDVYVAYEQQSGRALVVYGKGATSVYYRVWGVSDWVSEGSVPKPADAAGLVRWTTLGSDPLSNRIALGVLTTGSDVWLNVWNGTSWSASLTATNSAHGTTYPNMAVAFEGRSGEALAAYGTGEDSVYYRTWSNIGGWSAQEAALGVDDPPNSMILDGTSGSDNIMLSVQDDGEDLSCALWDGSSWGTVTELETSTTENKNQPFIFLWDYQARTTPTSFYVSASGDDSDDGLTTGTAWRSIDNGDRLGVLIPGDTVNILPGLYLESNTIDLSSSGTGQAPILYTGREADKARVRSIGGIGSAVLVEGDNLILRYVNVSADPLTTVNGITVDGDSCMVTGCAISGVYYDGIEVNSSANLILANVIFSCKTNGIQNTAGASGNRYYGNTLWDNHVDGIQLLGAGNANRILNSIVIENWDDGIDGPADNMCGYNDVWDNSGADYTGGVSDSSGGISEDPMLVDPAGGDFTLQSGSPAIDAGFDLGFPYKGGAPDMGALESKYAGAYYVSPAGDDGADGLTPGTAWLSIDNGDQKGILVPGDTINILPGTYLPASTVQLKTDGTASANIIYRKYGTGDAVVDMGGASNIGILIEGDHVRLDSLEVTGSSDEGVYVKSDSCGVSGMYVHHANKEGIRVEGKHHLFVGNIIAFAGEEGVKNEGSGEYTRYYNNTVYSSSKAGFDLKDNTSRLFNNIAVLNEKGIDGTSANVCGFNDVWGNTSSDYTGGVSDSAGGISADPDFFDPAGGDFRLQCGSPAIDAGLDLGYPYHGSAPDMGAVETDHCDSVAYIVVVPDTATVLEGTSLQYAAYGYTSDSTFVMDLTDSVSWSMTDPSGSITSGGLYTAGHDLSPPDYHVVATYAAMVDSGAVTVVSDGSLSYIRVELEDGRPFPDTTLTTDNDTTVLYCRGYDSGHNLLGDLVVNWSLTDGDSIGKVLAAGGMSTTLELLVVGTARVAARQGGGFADTSGFITCVAGEPADLIVSPDTAIMSADSTLQFIASGSDADGNPTGLLVTTAWEVLGGIGSIDSSGVFTAVTVGTGNIVGTGSVLTDTTGSIVVVAGEIAWIDVTPASTILTEGSSQQYAANGYDADSNFVADLTGSAGWTTTDPSGSVTAGGLYTAGHDLSPPDYHVVATYAAMVDSGVVMVVSDGSLSYVRVELEDGTPFPDTTLTTDNDTTRLYCRGYDSGDNPLGDQSVTWEVLGGDSVGEVSPLTGTSTTLTLLRVGTGRAGATHSITIKDTSGVITCIAGDPVWIDVLPGTQVVIEDSSYQFTTYGYDADSNLVNDFSADALWSTTDPSGSVTSAGLYTAGADPSPPAYYVKANLHLPLGSLHYVRDSSEVTVLTSGSLKYVLVESFDGTPFRDTTLTTDNDTTRLYCRGYDSGNNPVADLAVKWSLIGIDSIGTVNPGPATNTILELSRLGTGQVVGTYGPGMVDSTGIITCIAGAPAGLVIAPDTVTTSAGSSVQFTTSTLDADGNPSAPVTIDAWGVLGGIGTISGTGLLTAMTVGTGSVACSGYGLADTTGIVTILPGELSEIEITPDSAEVTLGGSLEFEAGGTDAYGNAADIGNLTWGVIGGIGGIDGSGTFSALAAGSGRITVESGINSVSDTNQVVTVLPSGLEMLVVTPDTATIKIAGSVHFTATGFDENFQPVPVGGLTWQVLGGIGSIDGSGDFVASTTGAGYVAATSTASGVGDTTGMIIVDIPTISEIPLGNTFAHAGESRVPVLGFTISNAFDGPEQLTGITLRDASSGTGNAGQVLSNIDSLVLYIDSNSSGGLDPSDAFIAGTDAISSTVNLSFSPVMIGPGSNRTFFVTATITQFPCDGDSLDFFLLPSTDIELAGGTPVAGPATLNSLGRCIIDGLIADQLTLVPTGTVTLTSESGLSNVLVIDIPRNGYTTDVLEIFSVFNTGAADTLDLNSLSLYMDDGNGTWSDGEEETYIGDLSFTGDQWELSGLSVTLTEQVTRFYLGVILSESAGNGATLALGVPLHALEMSSDNDGPIDNTIGPVETITIASTEMVLAGATQIETRELVPGTATGAITAIELVNRYAEAVYIDSIRFTNVGSDPDGASQAELDSQIDTVKLWLEGDGSYSTHGPGDSLIASGSLQTGKVVLTTGGMSIPAAGGVSDMTVECTLNRLTSKNANLINFAILEGTDIYFAEPVTLSGDFPLKNEEDFPVNTFPASNVAVHAVPRGTIFGGATDHRVFDFELPRNGYDNDVLRSLRIENTGSSNEQDALEAVKLWATSSTLGATQSGILLGEFEPEDGGWRISGLAYPLTDIGNRLFVTVDVATDDFEGGTLRFEIPIRGALYASGTDGPDDAPAGSVQSHLLFPANRITVIPIPAEASAVYPGAVRTPVLTFALYNGYAVQTHVLEAIRLSNGSRSVSTSAFADYELGQVSLYYDENTNRTFDDDILIASGYFTDRNLSLSGLNVSLPPESLAYFFVAANLPFEVIDSDTLDVTIDEHSDFTFGQSVNINGDLPLSRGGSLTIDGSVSGQYGLVPCTARTLSPGDTAVTLFAFRPASNGDQVDVLETLRIGNDADADTSDFTSLKLWRDSNGDETYQATDLLLGQATYVGGDWQFDGIGLEITSDAPVLFITGDVTTWAIPNSSFRPVVPVDGCRFASGNDGPLDVPLGGEHAFVVSTSGIKLTYEALSPQYSVGQPVEIRVHATNVLPATMYDVSCDISGIGEPGIVSLDSSSVARGMLAPGGTANFKASYTALGAGTAHWRIQAFSSNPADSSAPVETEPVVVQTAPSEVLVEMISSIPTAVTRGQRQVFPLSIKYRHSDPAPVAASIRLDSLRVRVETETGVPLAAGAVFSRMVLATGYTNLAILESLPDESTVLLGFSQPTVVSPGDEQILSLQVDIDSLAGASSFALTIESAIGIRFTDNNTGLAVAIDPAVEFPLKTASCRINNPSQRVAMSYVPGLSEYANYGQHNVDVVQLLFRHPGMSEDSQVQLTGLSFGFVDEGRNTVIAADLFDRIRLLRRETVLGELTGPDAGDSLLTMWLTSPPVVSPGEIDTLRLEASIKPVSVHTAFEMTIPDSTLFTLRDLSSGGTVTAMSDTGSTVGGSVFPMMSGLTRLKYPAVEPEICITSILPATVIAGSDSVTLVEISIDYPSGIERSAIGFESVRVAVLDTLERAIDPYRLFDRIGYRVPGEQANYGPFIELDRGYTVFQLGVDGITIEPGENVVVRLIADIEADTQFDHLLIRIYREDGLSIVDATDRSSHPGFVEAPECGEIFPFATDMTRILLPAGAPTVRVSSLPAEIAFPGQAGHTFFTADLVYGSSQHQGDLGMEYWRGRILRRGAGGLKPVSGDEVFERVSLLSNGQPVAVDTSFGGDSLSLSIDGEYILSGGEERAISLTCDIKSNAVLGNYVVEFADSAFAGFVDRDLFTVIHPRLAGGDYPVLTAEISVSAGDLAGSFSNWPNPFNPDRETTTIGFVLARDAEVDIEIFTITGELVKTVTAGAYRPAGAYEQDIWTGLNDSGHTVLPGTYFCRVTARYTSGNSEDVKRKVAVIR